MIVFHITDKNKPINVLNTFGCPTSHDKVDYKHLTMLQWEGLYWLIPIEILRECELILKQRLQDKIIFCNVLPPVTINIQQCIPIPSETAKILLEL